MSNTLKVSLIIIICFFITAILFANNRVKYNFNPQWKFYIGDLKGAENVDFNDSEWKTVSLPYAWNQEEAFKLDIHSLSTGIAWYGKHFKIPASHKDKYD